MLNRLFFSAITPKGNGGCNRSTTKEGSSERTARAASYELRSVTNQFVTIYVPNLRLKHFAVTCRICRLRQSGVGSAHQEYALFFPACVNANAALIN